MSPYSTLAFLYSNPLIHFSVVLLLLLLLLLLLRGVQAHLYIIAQPAASLGIPGMAGILGVPSASNFISGAISFSNDVGS